MQKHFQKIDIINELDRRGIQGKISGHNYMICCPFHNESNPSLGIAIEGDKKGLFQCLSSNCGKRGTFFHLIAFIDGVKLSKVKDKYKIDFDIELDVKNLSNYFLSQLKEKNNKSKIKILNKKVLKKFSWLYDKYTDYLKGPTRKLNSESIKKWKIICCDEGKWKNRVVIPVYDEKNRLISLVARSIDPDAPKHLKVRKLKKSDIKKVVFGLNHIKNPELLYLVEGEFDVIYLQQNNIPAVSTGGLNNISSSQIKKIANITDRLIISLDGDVVEEKIREVRKKINGYFKTTILYLPDKKDPNDLTKKQVNKLYTVKGGLK